MEEHMASATLLVPSALATVAALVAALAALRAARLSKAAAADSERVAASLVQLHRETERLHAAWRSGLAAVSPPAPVAMKPQPAPVAMKPQPAPAGMKPQPLIATPPLKAPPPQKAPPPPTTENDSDEATIILSARPTKSVPNKDGFHGLAMLRALTGPDQGREFTLPFDRSTMGRGNTNRVVLTEEKASRVHAEMYYDGTRFIFRDVGSTNGTALNGAPANGELPIEFGDIITIGRTELLLTCEGYNLKDSDPGQAIAAYERLLEHEGSYIAALQNLAVLLERDVSRRAEAETIQKKLKQMKA